MQIWGWTFCLSSSFYLNCSDNSCSFPALDSGSELPMAEGWQCCCIALCVSRYSSHEAADDGAVRTHRQVICSAGSSTKWGLFWWMTIELLLPNSKLYPALPMSILVRGWAADGGTACELLTVFVMSVLQTGLCWSPNSWCHATWLIS